MTELYHYIHCIYLAAVFSRVYHKFIRFYDI